MYHQVGIDILKNGGDSGGSFDPNDIFNSFFSGMGGFPGFGSRQSNKKNDKENVEERLYVSLEDIYNGKDVTFNYIRKIFCESCDGTGNKDKKLHECNVCNGSGQEVKVIKMGPMIQQHVQTCQNCRGTGKGNGNSEKCDKCKGKNHHVKKDSVTIPLKKEISNGMKLRLSGKGNKYKNGNSDLIIHIAERQHNIFKRQEHNLIMEMNIELIESIIGFEKEFKFLDGKVYKINFKKGLTIGDGDVKVIKGMGMKNVNSNKKGDLIIKFKVINKNVHEFSDNEKELLARIFKHKINKIDNKNEVELEDFNQFRFNDSNDDEGQPQCVHQ